MTLFVRQLIVDDTSAPYKYVGRYRAHYKRIVDVMFGKQLDSNASRLLSLGEDRHLVRRNYFLRADDISFDIPLIPVEYLCFMSIYM